MENNIKRLRVSSALLTSFSWQVVYLGLIASAREKAGLVKMMDPGSGKHYFASHDWDGNLVMDD